MTLGNSRIGRKRSLNSDVDAHYRQAKSAGATILTEPEDGPPGRRYRAEDIEGHRWMFMQREKE
jgi:uncharacterized glyoxalase superfamily protein PhnB